MERSPTFEQVEPVTLAPEVKEKLRAFTDGKGSWILAVPYGLPTEPGKGFPPDAPMFAGDAKRLWRVPGAGPTSAFPNRRRWVQSFWDPRSEFGPNFEGDEPELLCGGQRISYRAAADDESRRLLQQAELLERRWRRYEHAFARDDEFNYYLLDDLRTPDGEPAGKDYRLWVGPKKQMVPLAVKDFQEDSNGLVVITAAGKLEATVIGRSEWKAAWVAPDGSKRDLTWLNESWTKRKVLYLETNAYAGRPLGTPCDPHFARR